MQKVLVPCMPTTVSVGCLRRLLCSVSQALFCEQFRQTLLQCTQLVDSETQFVDSDVTHEAWSLLVNLCHSNGQRSLRDAIVAHRLHLLLVRQAKVCCVHVGRSALF